MKPEASSLRKPIKLIKTLTRLIRKKKKGDKLPISGMRNMTSLQILQIIKRIISGQLYTNKFSNGKFIWEIHTTKANSRRNRMIDKDIKEI